MSHLVLRRELTHNLRNRAGVGARFALTTFVSLLAGSIFLMLEVAMTLIVILGGMVGVLRISFGIVHYWLYWFIKFALSYRHLSRGEAGLLREYSTNHSLSPNYPRHPDGVAAYFISKLSIEALVTCLQVLEILLIVYFMVDLQAPFYKFFAIEYALAMSSTATAVLVGCSVEDPKIAIEFMPVLFMPQILFAGLFVRTELIPVWLSWAQYLCALMYAVRLALLAEFSDCANDSTLVPNSCKSLLEANEVVESDKALYWGVLWGLFVVFRLSGLAVLRKKAKKFY
eukprot:CCRYP_021227-RA/>CCRYP_021227-RA protein AED:0.30 eAED:0.30 QI:0/0.25/0.2/1/0.25/0.2/5/86/284